MIAEELVVLEVWIVKDFLGEEETAVWANVEPSECEDQGMR
jgi:hypothetical protein